MDPIIQRETITLISLHNRRQTLSFLGFFFPRDKNTKNNNNKNVYKGSFSVK